MSAGQLPPPGTVLRKYDRHGTVRCEAVVGEGGQVIYRGVTYSSISAAAKVAAGDIGLAARSCDGYAFFGLKGRANAAPRAPRPAGVTSPATPPQAPLASLPLPLPVRWDELPPAPPSANRNEIAAVTSASVASALQGVYTRDGGTEHVLVLATPPVSPIETAAERAPLTDEIVAETVFNHGKHGRADASGAPIDSDCACRGTTREKTCAESGCGFCRAAQSMARLTGSAPIAPVIVPGDASVIRDLARCTIQKAQSIGVDNTAFLSLAPDIDAPSSVDLRQREAELAQSLDDPASAGARQALDFAYGNLACSTRHKPDRETFRRLWAERKLPAEEFNAWAASRTWWDREPIDDRPLPDHYGEPCVLHGKPVQYNIGDGLRCVDCLPQGLAYKALDEAKEIAAVDQQMQPCVNCDLPAAGHGPGAEPPIACDSYVPVSAGLSAPAACNMIVDHKAIFDYDKEGRVVGVEPGDEIECGKPAVKQVAGDPKTRLCAECAAVWEADRLGELEPIAIENAGATVADLAPIIDEQARAESARVEATLTFEQDPPTAVLTIAPPVPPEVDAALERLRAEADAMEETAALVLREPDARSAQENLPALLASTVDPRDVLGQRVREVWVAWAHEQPAPKPSWLLPWEGLSEPDREVDRRIGEALFKMGVEAEAFADRIGTAALRRTIAEIRDTLFAAVEGDVDPDERLIDTLKRIVRERDTARAGKRAEAASSESVDVSKMRAELLAEIDAVTMGTPFWRGGRLDTIKHLLAVAKTASAEVDQGSAPEGSPAAPASSTEGERRQDADAVGTAQTADFLPLRQLESTGPAPAPDHSHADAAETRASGAASER